MKRYQWISTLSCYLVEFLIAWHLLSHGIMVPATTPIYCNNTNKTIKDVLTTKELNELYTEACSKDCPKVIVSNKYYDLTIVHQYELYCNGRDKYTTAAQMISMLGVFVGNFAFGYFADTWGRKLTLIIACVSQAPIGVAIAFSPNVYCFLVFKFLLNVFLGGAMVTAFVLFTEIVGAKWRPITGLGAQFPFTLAHLSVTGFGYGFRDWRWIQLATSLPAIILVYYYWVLPESPRWLIAVGKIEEGIKQVEIFARKNKLPTDNVRKYILEDVEQKKSSSHQEFHKGKFKDLFHSCRMTLITLFTWINWFAIICCYYGVAQFSAALGTNLYQSYALSAVTQQPSLWFLFYTINYWGRRWTLVFSNALACVSLLCIHFTPVGDYQVIPASIGMFGLAMSFPAIYVYSSEVFPTPIRNMGMGSSSALARIGAMFGALVADLRSTAEWIPPVAFSSLMAFATIGYIFLPETKGIVLPSTVQDTEKLRSLSQDISRTTLRPSTDKGLTPKDARTPLRDSS